MLLEKLTEACGISGNEAEVRNIIIEEINGFVDEIKTDRLGNLIAIKKGKEGFPKIMLAAHMDEVGLMVKAIDENGFLKFDTVGGIDERILISKQVLIGKDKVPGVIGAKAIHLQESDERTTPLKIRQLYIDIGAKNKESAEKVVKRGDYVAFSSEYVEFGNNLVKAKALDNRVGCAVLIDILKEEYDVNIYGVFTVQEEIGLRGAKVSAYDVEPDFAVVFEGTLCSDITEVPEDLHITKLGKGPAISLMDSYTIFSKVLNKRIDETAVENNIDIQYRQPSPGGNDAGNIHITKEGIPCAALSVPCRYIHSPSSVMCLKDFEGCKKTIKLFLKGIKKGEFVNERD